MTENALYARENWSVKNDYHPAWEEFNLYNFDGNCLEASFVMLCPVVKLIHRSNIEIFKYTFTWVLLLVKLKYLNREKGKEV